MRLSRRYVWLGVGLGFAVLLLATSLVRTFVGGDEPADSGGVVNLGHVCGKNQPEVFATPSSGETSFRVDCLGGGLASPEFGAEVVPRGAHAPRHERAASLRPRESYCGQVTESTCR
jgi:hypothetical protein